MSDSYYSTPNAGYTSPAERYGQMTSGSYGSSNPLALAGTSQPQANGYGYYSNVAGDGTGNSGGAWGGGYGRGPGYGGQVNLGTNGVPDYTQPQPPAPQPPTTPTNPTPTTPPAPTRQPRPQPTAQQLFQRSFADFMKNQNGPGRVFAGFGAADRAERMRRANAPATGNTLRLAEGGLATLTVPQSGSIPDYSNAQPMPMPTIPADSVPMPMPRERRPMPPIDRAKIENPIYRYPSGSVTPGFGLGSAPPPTTGLAPPPMTTPPGRGPIQMPANLGPGNGRGNAWGRLRLDGMKPYQMDGFGGRGPQMGGRPPVR